MSHDHPKPPDSEITKHLESLCEGDLNELQHYLGELFDTVEDTVVKGEPEIWAYGKLINFLTNGLEHDLLIHVCASALWKLHGQGQAKLYVIDGEKETDQDGSNSTQV